MRYLRLLVFFCAVSLFISIAPESLALDPADFKAQLGVIDTTLEQARVLKADKNPSWKHKVYEAYGDLKRIFRGHTTSPEVYLLFAKSYWINNRFGKAEKSLRKAFYYKPGYTEAFILSGDMYLEEAEKTEGKMGFMEDDKDLRKDFEKYRSKAKSSYEKVLAGADLDTVTRASLYYKLGNTYHSLYGNKIKAREQWSRAVSTLPDSVWGKKAQEKLLASK